MLTVNVNLKASPIYHLINHLTLNQTIVETVNLYNSFLTKEQNILIRLVNDYSKSITGLLMLKLSPLTSARNSPGTMIKNNVMTDTKNPA